MLRNRSWIPFAGEESLVHAAVHWVKEDHSPATQSCVEETSQMLTLHLSVSYGKHVAAVGFEMLAPNRRSLVRNR